MPYVQTRMPAIATVDDLRRYLDQELQALALASNETTEIYLRPISAAPDRLRDGLVVYADGTNFNPGSGAGLYERRGGAWHKL